MLSKELTSFTHANAETTRHGKYNSDERYIKGLKQMSSDSNKLNPEMLSTKNIEMHKTKQLQKAKAILRKFTNHFESESKQTD